MATGVGAPGPRLASALGGLRAQLRGELLQAGDRGYDEARRVWNGAIDRCPAAIARCAAAADVVAAVRSAREHDMLVSVRGGGHGVSGHAVCDGGLMIDLSPMKRARPDPGRRLITAQAGLTWGEFDQLTQRFGLAAPGGIITHTGISGLTLGGGIGWLMRKHGATVDSLRSVQVVTADGQLVTADHEQNPDLFWGVRGGGGNFGIVTSLEYRLHDLGPVVLGGPLIHPLGSAAGVLRFYRDFVADAPDALTTIVNLRRAPPLPVVPRDLHGRPIVSISVCYAGPVEAGETVLRPLRRYGKPLIDAIRPIRYTELQAMFDRTVPHGWHYYWKSCELPPLADEAIDVLVAHAAPAASPLSYCIIFQLGGALGRVPADEAPFAQRDAGHNVNINAVWTGQDPARHVGWARRFHAALRPFARDRVYVNFLGEEGAQRVCSAYGPAAYERLAALKARYDPANFFRGNQNIPPRPGGQRA